VGDRKEEAESVENAKNSCFTKQGVREYLTKRMGNFSLPYEENPKIFYT
jgi:hypothetical protein